MSTYYKDENDGDLVLYNKRQYSNLYILQKSKWKTVFTTKPVRLLSNNKIVMFKTVSKALFSIYVLYDTMYTFMYDKYLYTDVVDSVVRTMKHGHPT